MSMLIIVLIFLPQSLWWLSLLMVFMEGSVACSVPLQRMKLLGSVVNTSPGPDPRLGKRALLLKGRYHLCAGGHLLSQQPLCPRLSSAIHPSLNIPTERPSSGVELPHPMAKVNDTKRPEGSQIIASSALETNISVRTAARSTAQRWIHLFDLDFNKPVCSDTSLCKKMGVDLWHRYNIVITTW